MKIWLCLLLACLFVLPMAGCSEGDHADDFISFKRIYGSGSDRVWVGEARDEINLGFNSNPGDEAMWIKYDKEWISTSISTTGRFWATYIGELGIENRMSEVLPAYAGIPGITIVEDTPTRIVMEKTIDGCRYTLTFVGYDDGSIKSANGRNEDTFVPAQ